jgi:hypothetical protein
MMRAVGGTTNLDPMDVRSGPAFRIGEALLAVGLTRMSRTSPVAYVVGRAALTATRKRLLEREARRRAARRRQIRRSVLAGTFLVAAVGTGLRLEAGRR